MTQTTKIGVLLVNLGTPTAPTAQAVAQYLTEFLSDHRVIEVNPLIWQPLLRLRIVPKRAPKVAKKYESIWLPQGSPLLVYTRNQAHALQQSLNNPNIVVDYAMRYGQPNIHNVLDKLRTQGCEKVFVLPMYPQFSATTAGTIIDQLCRYNLEQRDQLEIRYSKSYGTHPLYIQALVNSVKEHWQTHGQPKVLLLSYHSLPISCIEKGDPYQHECVQTSHLIEKALNTPDLRVLTSYQSVFGKAEWVKPSTEQTVRQLAQSGVKHLQVLTPGFSADCIETLEEVGIDYAHQFKEEGGEQFSLIPCLNDRHDWMEAMQALINIGIAGWV